jgi:hypothetical protein
MVFRASPLDVAGPLCWTVAPLVRRFLYDPPISQVDKCNAVYLSTELSSSCDKHTVRVKFEGRAERLLKTDA